MPPGAERVIGVDDQIPFVAAGTIVAHADQPRGAGWNRRRCGDHFEGGGGGGVENEQVGLTEVGDADIGLSTGQQRRRQNGGGSLGPIRGGHLEQEGATTPERPVLQADDEFDAQRPGGLHRKTQGLVEPTVGQRKTDRFQLRIAP